MDILERLGFTVCTERPRSRAELLARIGELLADNETLAADLCRADEQLEERRDRIAQLITERDHGRMLLRHAERSARVLREHLCASMARAAELESGLTSDRASRAIAAQRERE